MIRFFASLFVAFSLLCGGGAVAQQLSPDQFADALKKYEPATVEAAAAYAKTFDFRSQLEKAAPALSAAMLSQLKAKNPEMNEEQTKLFVDTYMHIALVDNAPVLEQATILTMLEIFDKPELDALNQFYSSPVGAQILKKFPIMMGRMPQIVRLMQTYIMPKALAGARDALKQRGVEVKI